VSRILVTGASGFIGSAAVAALARDGHTVRAMVRRTHPFPAGVEAVQHPDLTEAFDLQPLLDGIDRVVHLAGIAHNRGVGAGMHDRVNREATARLASAAAQAGVTQFVFVSSIRAQCGPAADHALTERDPPAPIDAYGASKLAAEMAVQSSGVPFTILRPVALYGPGVKGYFALLARAAVSPLPLPVKDFGNRRSLLGIDNFISALEFVLATPATIGETYVVADPGIPPRLSDVIAAMRKARRRFALILPLPTDYVKFPLRLIGRGDMWDRIGGNLRVDAGKLIAAGWRPSHDTLAGVAAMAQAAAPRKSGTASRSTR
jgi:nucleoside-diphosphate-sugar epimerase